MIKIVILGIVQGLTEFLPVSSSGHLLIFEKMFGIVSANFSLEIALHIGSLLAVIVYFRKRIIQLFMSIIHFRDESYQEDRQFVFYIVIAMFFTGIIGISLKDWIVQFKGSLLFIGSSLVFTSLLLFSANIKMKKSKSDDKGITWFRSIIIGIFQGIAVIPGVSRSGSTITAALFSGISPRKAAEFSFILSIPAILCAFLLDFEPGFYLSQEILFGMLASFLSGLFAIRFFLGILQKGKLNYFGFYCLIVGIYLIIS
ncbi:MAG: hypothetical protein A2Y40_07165 [Candidatus Margulisbacteria bacterium GWF2_35_9]|nr:MAG: hypothetical protein A2Y40_07165 [Candidatus Margulisbacteria bacterium GWF2_35_9]